LVEHAGLTSVLSGAAAIDQVIQEPTGHHVKVLGPGPRPANPSELLGSQQMLSVVASLRKQFDYVVIDAPPLLAVTDGAVLATLSDGVIVVARRRHTRIDELRSALGILEGVDCNFLGTILNTVTTRGGKGSSDRDSASAPPTIAPHIKPDPVTSRKSWLRSGDRGNQNGHPPHTRHSAPSARRRPNGEVRTDG
jgi:Mrp family chromosome partitioning ATPase